jgi:hypothetical protein
MLPYMWQAQEKSFIKPAATLVNGTTVFTVSGGPIAIISIGCICITANNSTATTLQYSADGTDGAATTITGASATLANATAGTIVHSDQGNLATALAIHVNGVGITTVSPQILVPAGVITTVVGVGSSTGTWQHYIRYVPLTPNSIING